MKTTRARIAVLAVLLLAASAIGGSGERPELARAEALFDEGSYRQALGIYRALADEVGDDPALARWVAFRIADAGWRSAAASNDPDDTEIAAARDALEKMVRDVVREEDRDRVWAEVEESLGDLAWAGQRGANWSAAWPHYERALGWWAGSSEIDLARERYLAIVRRALRPAWFPRHAGFGYYGSQVPVRVLEDARRIAVDPEDVAWIDYAIASGLQSLGGDPGANRRARAAFERALETGTASDWYDDALFQYAQWLERRGTLEKTDDGAWHVGPDFVAALERYRQLVRTFGEGESRHRRQAQDRIEAISQPSLTAAVSDIFLPGSLIRVQLGWRNVEAIELAIYPIELGEDLRPDRTEDERDVGGWLEAVPLAGRKAAHRETIATDDDGTHRPGSRSLLLEPKLEPGAYLMEARAGDRTARDLVLVTGTSLVIKSAAGRALVWVVDAESGAPRTGAEVSLWVGRYDGRTLSWSRLEGSTDGDGLVDFDPATGDRRTVLFATARSGDDRAFGRSWTWDRDAGEPSWKLYVFPDRPAYRPGERVQWKVIARTERDGRLETPAGRGLRYRLVDPRGAELDRGELKLNGFGSAWSSTALGGALPLGEYRVEFRDEKDERTLGGAVLFRMEEYRLPEFQVTVGTPFDEQGNPKRFAPGDDVEVEIAAATYFGAPVAGAKVEVIVRQRPLWPFRFVEPQFPWLEDGGASETRLRGPGGGYGAGQEVHRETLRTDADGHARFRYATPWNSDQDFDYTIEARVTDAARREVVGNGTVRVTRQSYFAEVDVDHRLVAPGDRVKVTVRARSADERPVRETGELRITRRRWVEIWVDPRGHEVRDPAKVRADQPGWSLISKGYESEFVALHELTTGDDGEVELAFEPEDEGYYGLAWTGDEEALYPVTAETMIWVADPDSVELGYRPGGVQILVDRDTVRAGGTTPVMVSVPHPGSFVLFSVESDELLDRRVVEVRGDVRLIELPIDDRHIPNVFLEAATVRDGELFLDRQELVVPPVDKFLTVEVEPGAEEHRPGGAGTLDLRTLDRDGRPVSAEVALALVDESIFAIQPDLAGDPRPFFYGTRRGQGVTTRSTFNEKPYTRLRRSDGVGVEEGRNAVKAGAVRPEPAMAADAVQEGAVFGRSMARQKAEFEADLAVPARQDAGGAGDVVQVRTDFRATALWLPDVVTDKSGRAKVEVTFPESLTRWKATARAVADGSRFGIGEATTRTSKPLTVRLQAPRFFVVGDEAIVSGVVNNNSDRDLEVAVTLTADGLDRGSAGTVTLSLPAGGERRADWTVDARTAGKATLQVVARSDGESDAMQRIYPVEEHGIEKFLARTGKVSGDALGVTLDLPRERREGSTTLTVQVTPSLAVTMLDALPYLIDYPYGCTEQTMSRFLPAAVVRHTLEQLGIPRRAVSDRLFGGATDTAADETGRVTIRKDNLDRLDEVVRAGLERLADFQHGDGGWGWWKQGDSDPFMTAYVVWGLGLAREADVSIDDGMLRRGSDWLERRLVEEETRPDMQAFMLHALASSGKRGRRPTAFEAKAFDNVWSQRDRLNAYTRALLALAAWSYGDEERARVLVRNLENGVQVDDRPDRSVIVEGMGGDGAGVVGTAHWGEDGLWWRWSQGGVEATAFALRALLAIDPGNALVEPVTNWLLKNRRGARWSNTRDTTIVLLAMTDFLKTSGEMDNALEWAIEVNGRRAANGNFARGELLRAPSRVALDPSLLRDGKNEVRIVRTGGDAPIYFAVESTYFSLEEPVTPAGHEIFVRRRYYRQVPRPTLLLGPAYDARPLEDGGETTSGERIEVVLTVETKNHYEYLVFEDLKPAGFEAVELTSGGGATIREVKSAAIARPDGKREPQDYTGRARWVHDEYRDSKVALFVDQLPEGVWEIRYELRAETPGAFHALPLMAHAMYVPEIRANGAEVRVRVLDGP